MTGRPATFLVLLLCLVLGASNHASAGVEVLLALDRSLSMANNDPDRDSLEAVKVFSALLKPDDRFGVLTFAEKAELRLPSRSMAGTDVQGDLKAFLNRVEMDGVRTDFGAALRLGRDTYASQPAADGADRILVLFTDGQLNLGSEAATLAARQAIFDDILPQYRAAGTRIFGVAFSSAADLEFLDRLAEATNGQSFRVERPEDLYEAFVQLFEQADIPLTMPVVGDQIHVDSSIQGLELLVKRGLGEDPMRLIDPSDREHAAKDQASGIEWQTFDDFEHIRIKDPQAGTWRLSSSSSDKRAYIESDLDVEADIPLRIQVGKRVTVNAALINRAPGGDPALLEEARLEARILDLSGWQLPAVSFESVSADGNAHRFRGELFFAAAGNVRVEVSARGRGFERTKYYPVTVGLSAPLMDPVSVTDAKAPEHVEASTSSKPPNRSAAMILLLANGLILIILLLLFGIWWWRRCACGSADQDDTDLGI